MKVVINACFGGFSLSPKGIAEWAKRKGRPCFFFLNGREDDGSLSLERRVSCSMEQAEKSGLMFWAYDIPNPEEIFKRAKSWHEMTSEEKAADNALHDEHDLCDNGRDIARDDLDLIAVVEQLGAATNGRCAKLEIVEIPDGTDYVIEEYDGNEHVAERHRTWG